MIVSMINFNHVTFTVRGWVTKAIKTVVTIKKIFSRRYFPKYILIDVSKRYLYTIYGLKKLGNRLEMKVPR